MVVPTKASSFKAFSINSQNDGHKKSRWTKSETPVKLEL